MDKKYHLNLLFLKIFYIKVLKGIKVYHPKIFYLQPSVLVRSQNTRLQEENYYHQYGIIKGIIPNMEMSCRASISKKLGSSLMFSNESSGLYSCFIFELLPSTKGSK